MVYNFVKDLIMATWQNRSTEAVHIVGIFQTIGLKKRIIGLCVGSIGSN